MFNEFVSLTLVLQDCSPCGILLISMALSWENSSSVITSSARSALTTCQPTLIRLQILINIFSRVCSLTSSVGCTLLFTKPRIIFAFSHTRTLLTHLQLVTHHIPIPFSESLLPGALVRRVCLYSQFSCLACVHIELHPTYFKCQDHLQI